MFFFESDFVEARNSELQAHNVKEKGAVLCKDIFEIFEIIEHSFLPKHYQKSIGGGVSSPVCCKLWSYKFIKRKLSYTRFSGKFPKFLVQLFQNTLMKTSVMDFRSNLGC